MTLDREIAKNLRRRIRSLLGSQKRTNDIIDSFRTLGAEVSRVPVETRLGDEILRLRERMADRQIEFWSKLFGNVQFTKENERQIVDILKKMDNKRIGRFKRLMGEIGVSVDALGERMALYGWRSGEIYLFPTNSLEKVKRCLYSFSSPSIITAEDGKWFLVPDSAHRSTRWYREGRAGREFRKLGGRRVGEARLFSLLRRKLLCENVRREEYRLISSAIARLPRRRREEISAMLLTIESV